MKEQEDVTGKVLHARQKKEFTMNYNCRNEEKYQRSEVREMDKAEGCKCQPPTSTG